MRDQVEKFFRELQSRICAELEVLDGRGSFQTDKWDRPGGGGGESRVLSGGHAFEKCGVNFSSVHGPTTEYFREILPNVNTDDNFFATGVSIVIHPVNPFVPIIHMNVRYFEIGKHAWFGGGIDLTPHYIDRGDAFYFHNELKKMCDQFDTKYYPGFKKNADDYFFIRHRQETRGIGGIFFDRMDASSNDAFHRGFEFVRATGNLFIPVYSRLVNKNKDKGFSEREINWQNVRRSRYVEFNLVYDKGTKFGLETGGRTESILMSLPPVAVWKYGYQPEKGSAEKQTLDLLKKNIDWLSSK